MLHDNDIQAVERLTEAHRQIKHELAKAIVGQQEVIEQLLIVIFAGGHCLLVGVPGLAKTLMIRTVAQALSLQFSRIQFTPDLMPSDITGTEVIQEDKVSGTRQLRFMPGPVFANIILADEINRTPPKTQAALLEAMQEHQVTAGGQKHALPEPFFVLATQNPIEQEGTYPLPEAQLDRFMFHVRMDYPSEEEELQIVKQTTADLDVTIKPTLRRRADCRAGPDCAQGSGGGSRGPLRPAAGAAALGPVRARYPSLSAITSCGEPARAPANTLCWAPRPGPCWPAASTSAAKTSAPSPCRCCATAFARISTPMPRASRPKSSSRASSIPSRLRTKINIVEDPQRFLDPRTLAKLHGLRLRARHIVEGYMAGLHRSPLRGFSVEFAEHREYAPGDDPALCRLEGVRPHRQALFEAA